MRVVFNEIKKIFNLTNLLIMGIATILIWVLYMSFEIESFPNGAPATPHYNISVDMLNKYGTTMDEKEYEDFKLTRENMAKEATNYLSSNEEYVKLGIGTYDEFMEKSDHKYSGNNDKDIKRIDDIRSKIMFEERVDIFWNLQAIDYLIDRYDNDEFWISSMTTHPTQEQSDRSREIIEKGYGTSPLNYVVMRNYKTLIEDVNILILVSILIMISPIFIKDNKNKVSYLQYSSKIGRSLIGKKIISGVISSIIIITIQLAIFFAIYSLNNTYMFWDCSMNSAVSDFTSWFDLTFGQYIILTVIFTYIIGIVMAVISMYVSSKVNDYIGLIGIQVPILFIYGWIIKSFAIEPIGFLGVPIYTLPVLYGILILILITIIFTLLRKGNKSDILI